MATYVVVPGAYSGAWYLKEVGQLLQAAGHTVYRCTLTGLGERVHLANPEVRGFSKSMLGHSERSEESLSCVTETLRLRC